MEVRSLRELGEVSTAYALADQYRAEASGEFKIALDEQQDIIAQRSRSGEFSSTHLEKVFKRIAGLPIAGEELGFRVQQANYDFDLYFINEIRRQSSRARDLPHDWWLRSNPPEAQRSFVAVHEIARKYEGIDWVQAYHASAAYDQAATWFAGPDLSVLEPDYERVTAHVYEMWKSGLPRWGMLLAERVPPDSKYVPEITAYVDELNERAQSCSLSPSEFAIYARMVHHLVRIHASNGAYDTALNYLAELNRNRLYPSFESTLGTNRAFAKLLIVRGEYEQLQLIQESLDAHGSRQRRGFRANSTVFAPSALWTVASVEELSLKHPDYFMSLLNMMSSRTIEQFVMPTEGRPLLRGENASRAAEVLWMRGFLFDDEDQMSMAEPLLLDHHPTLKRYFRQAAAARSKAARDFAFAVMVLRNPGLSPYFDAVRQTRDFEIGDYDRLNPIQGNWWCSGEDRAHLPSNEALLKTRFFTSKFRAGQRWPTRRNAFTPSQAERDKVNAAWEQFRSVFPPFSQIDAEEQAKLEAMPRASVWLSNKVRAYVESSAGVRDRRSPHDERIPESLHRLVEATRFSCHTLETGNGQTSQWAFSLLHEHYEESTWTAETPYWFDRVSRR